MTCKRYGFQQCFCCLGFGFELTEYEHAQVSVYAGLSRDIPIERNENNMRRCRCCIGTGWEFQERCPSLSVSALNTGKRW